MRSFSFFLRAGLGIFLLLALLEGVLRFAGGIYLWRSQQLNAAAVKSSPKSLVILALGESTTADASAPGPESAWPRQLQAALRQEKLDVAVVNGGVAGTTSPLILDRLGELLDEYQPDLVVAMMGVNDTDSLRYTESPLRNWRLYKLWAWAAERIRWIGRPPPLSRRTLSHGDFGPLQMGAVKELRSKGPEHAATFLASNLPEDVEAQALLLVELLPEAAGPQVLRLAEIAFELFPANLEVINTNLHLHTFPDRSLCISLGREIVRRRYELDGYGTGMLAHCLNEDPALGEFLSGRPIQVARHAEERAWITDHHYRALWVKLKERGIPLVAMQYPTLSVETVKSYFTSLKESERRGLYFVSNEQKFQEALRRWPYEKVFTDRFGGTWGHTTFFGHRLIVESLAPVVKEIFSSRVPGRRADRALSTP